MFELGSEGLLERIRLINGLRILCIKKCKTHVSRSCTSLLMKQKRNGRSGPEVDRKLWQSYRAIFRKADNVLAMRNMLYADNVTPFLIHQLYFFLN